MNSVRAFRRDFFVSSVTRRDTWAAVRRRLPLTNGVGPAVGAFKGAHRRIDVTVRKNMNELHRKMTLRASRRNKLNVG
jgi:hypothetical protein